MVFSEAEMAEQGLSELDLTEIELRILDLNKRTADDWTLMLNYVNMDGITPEIIYQHMALVATFNFCEEFTTSRFLTDSLALQPSSVDLRNISFDSVMRVLMLNATRDTTYTYGDTMYNVIQNSDILSAFLLLLSSAVSVWAIPLSRNILMFLLLFLGIGAAATNLIVDAEQRVRVTFSYITNLAVFLALNVGYYLIISVMLGVNTTSAVLTPQGVTADIQSPVGILLILLLISSLYLYAEIRLIRFTVRNYKDMGAYAYGQMFQKGMVTITSQFHSVGERISGAFQNFTERGEREIKVSINSSWRGGEGAYDADGETPPWEGDASAHGGRTRGGEADDEADK
jgi:hypothetical protein